MFTNVSQKMLIADDDLRTHIDNVINTKSKLAMEKTLTSMRPGRLHKFGPSPIEVPGNAQQTNEDISPSTITMASFSRYQRL